MRALQIVELTGADGLRLVQIPEPPGDEGLLAEVHALGVGFPHLLRSKGMYQERSEPPYTLNGIAAGVVVRAPTGSAFKVGDRIAGTSPAGAAERAVVTESTAIRLPSSLSFAQGAALGNFHTAVFALAMRGRLREGEVVLVHGAAGGSGAAALQVARALGGRALGVVSSDAKAAFALRAGAEAALRSDGPWKDDALRMTGGRGVDVVFDAVGGDRMLDTIRVLGPGGRWLIVGFTGGAIPQIPANRVLLRGIDVVGVNVAAVVPHDPGIVQRVRDRVQSLVDTAAISPLVGRTYALADGAQALRDIEQRRTIGQSVLLVR